MEKGRMRGIQGYIFPVAAGFIGGVAAALIMMLLAALAASALKLSDGGLRLLVWLPVIFGGFAAGGMGAGFAPDLKLPCGLLPDLLLWAAVLLLQQEYGLMELLRGGVILLSGGAGAAAFSQGRKKFKPGKGRPGMRRARPRKGPF